MSKFEYSDEETALNKVLKMNQEISTSHQNSSELSSTRRVADDTISSSMELLYSLEKGDAVEMLSKNIAANGKNRKLVHRPVAEKWDELVELANDYMPTQVVLEDIMSESEIEEGFNELNEINQDFSKATSIINKTDLSVLAIATALQVVKSLIFPIISEKRNYGESFDKSTRLNHNDKTIRQTQKKASEDFLDKQMKKSEAGYWVDILYQTPAYDITKGSKDLGIRMGGAYHRMYTLGHDPILGWIFGTMNIMTDTITFNSFQSYRVKRNPMRITKEFIPMRVMFSESYRLAKADSLNLPAAIFAQAQHLKSDGYTKLGLPVPILSSINEVFASELYKSNYDTLCFSRDLKIIGISFAVSKLFDIIISLVHGLFRKENESKGLFEIRTRKILLISNSIASTSTIINASITSNPKNIDIGSLLNTVTHLFTDNRFFLKIKREFIEGEISDRLQKEIEEIDKLYDGL